jgi:methionyl-tRNA formyltransferase
MTRLRLAFMGTPDFAVPALRALHEAGYEIAAVYTQPPRPAGRGQALRLSPVHALAERLGLPVRTPARLRRDTEAHAAFAALGLDVAVVAAYGLILPAAMLTAPRRGCLNVHASLLPRWRGAAPIQAAILAGDRRSGVTIMQMEEGLDTGPMLLDGAVPIDADSTGQTLHDALAPLGASLILRALEQAPAARPQPEAGVTYAPKLSRQDGRLDWSEPAAELDRRVRALHPWPGAFTALDGLALKIIAAVPEPAAHAAAPGTVLDARLAIATGDGALRIARLQLPGRTVLAADVFLRGHPVPAGHRLG